MQIKNGNFMKTVLLGLVLLSAFLTGCASNPMAVATDQSIQAPGPNEAKIVFMRSSFVGSAISSSLHDVTDSETKFIGVLANGTKIVHSTTPGKHTFMVVSEAADFMEANLEGGKTYYSIITPRMGAWKARFSMWPIKNDANADYYLDSDDVKGWIAGTKRVENTAESRQWFEKNKDSVNQKRQINWPVWEEKTPEELARRTLEQGDGR